MATARKSSSKINLLPQEEFAVSTIGRILTWLLSTFRIIVIITEIVVMGAFLSRFWLDAKANDLNEEIRRRQAVIGTTTDFEKEFRSVQEKLDSFAKITAESTSPTKYLETVTSLLPIDMSLSSFQIVDKTIQIRGSSPSEKAISQLITNLKNEVDFGKVVLTGTNISQQDKSLIIFSIRIEL